jgi:TonB family protein
LHPSFPPNTGAIQVSRPKLSQEGFIFLTSTVEADGAETALEIRISSGFSRLDSAALSAVNKRNFVPAQQDEKTRKKMHEQKLHFWISGHSWIKVDQKSDAVEVYLRLYASVKDRQKIIVLFNLRQLETPEGGRKTKYPHGMSVLVNQEVNCSSKTFRDVVTTAWSRRLPQT